MILALSIVLLILILNLFNIRICFIYNLFHIPCPGCGCTRAFIELLKGNINKSIEYNPLPLLLAIICVIIVLWNIIDYIRKEQTFKLFVKKYQKIIILLSIILTIIVWVINLRNPLLY